MYIHFLHQVEAETATCNYCAHYKRGKTHGRNTVYPLLHIHYHKRTGIVGKMKQHRYVDFVCIQLYTGQDNPCAEHIWKTLQLCVHNSKQQCRSKHCKSSAVGQQ